MALRKIISLLLFLGILPFFLLSFFNHPAGDDWAFQRWVSQYSLLDFIVYIYKNWSGRYFNFFINYVNHAAPDWLAHYKLLPVLLLSAYGFSVYFLVRHFLSGLCVVEARIFSLLLTLLYINGMPSLSEGFYWMTGAFYIYSVIFGNLFIYFLGRFQKGEGFIYAFLAFLSLVCTVGSNEIALVLINLLLLARLFFSFIQKQWRESKILGIFFIISLIFSLVVVLAPGNFVRSSGASQSGKVLVAFSYSFVSTVYHLLNWLTHSWLIPLSILLVPRVIDLLNRQSIKFFPVPLWLSLLLSFVFLWGGFFPIFYGLGNQELPDRAVNVIYWAFIFLWFYNLSFGVYILKEKYPLENYQIPRYVFWASLVFLSLNALVGNGIKIKRDGSLLPDVSLTTLLDFVIIENRIGTAYHDLLSGKAYRYDQHLKQRYEEVRQFQGDSLEIEALKDYPMTIFHKELNHDHWSTGLFVAVLNPKIKHLRLRPIREKMHYRNTYQYIEIER